MRRRNILTAAVCSLMGMVAHGVYLVESHTESLLSKAHSFWLLELNELGSKYGLTLIVKTERITDASIPVLAKLTSADLIVVADSGMSDSGIEELGALLSETRVPARAHNKTKSQAIRPAPGSPSRVF